MPVKQNDVEKSLLLKGFQASNNHHKMFHYYSKDGKKTRINTKTSHGNKEISDPIVGQMARQLGLTKAQFDALVQCPLDRDEYEKILASSGVVAQSKPTQDNTR